MTKQNRIATLSTAGSTPETFINTRAAPMHNPRGNSNAPLCIYVYTSSEWREPWASYIPKIPTGRWRRGAGYSRASPAKRNCITFSPELGFCFSPPRSAERFFHLRRRGAARIAFPRAQTAATAFPRNNKFCPPRCARSIFQEPVLRARRRARSPPLAVA